MGTCTCGRSPTGNCVGWHRLTEEGYKLKLINKVCDTMLESLWKEGKFYPELADKSYHAFIKGFKMITEIIEKEEKDEKVVSDTSKKS